MGNILFRRIKDGGDTISRDAFTCYGLWRDDNIAGAVEVAERIVQDARTILKQAEDVLGQVSWPWQFDLLGIASESQPSDVISRVRT
jgi:hypothetical protein